MSILCLCKKLVEVSVCDGIRYLTEMERVQCVTQKPLLVIPYVPVIQYSEQRRRGKKRNRAARPGWRKRAKKEGEKWSTRVSPNERGVEKWKKIQADGKARKNSGTKESVRSSKQCRREWRPCGCCAACLCITEEIWYKEFRLKGVSVSLSV